MIHLRKYYLGRAVGLLAAIALTFLPTANVVPQQLPVIQPGGTVEAVAGLLFAMKSTLANGDTVPLETLMATLPPYAKAQAALQLVAFAVENRAINSENAALIAAVGLGTGVLPPTAPNTAVAAFLVQLHPVAASLLKRLNERLWIVIMGAGGAAFVGRTDPAFVPNMIRISPLQQGSPN